MDEKILEQTKNDLAQDFSHLHFLFSSQKKLLQTFLVDIEKQKKHIRGFEKIWLTAKENKKNIENILSELQTINKSLERKNLNDSKITLYTNVLKDYEDFYRTYLSIIAGIITSADWQSPTFGYSKDSLAGRQTGKIIASYNDYKRDYHLDVRRYELLFKKQYLSGFMKFRIPVYLTSSGMAALTTILNFLEMEQKITGPILLGSSSYFQNKELIKRLFTGVIEVHEHNTEEIMQIIKTKKPSVLFFDSLCNSHDIAIPDLRKIVEILKQVQDNNNKDVYIVIDNTCLGALFQPLQLLGKFPKNIHMIVFESMNKYYEFGTDRTTGGIIYTWGKDTDKLFFIRQHTGTIMPDINTYQLPIPNRSILDTRLKRHERNAAYLANALMTYITENPNSPVETIYYPALSHHPAYDWAKNYSYHGSFFTFSWQKKYDTIKTYNKFLSLVLEEAKKQNVQIVTGTSFGLNSSRIYLTAPNTKFGKPFVRFSVGTESIIDIEKIKKVLIKALENL